MILTSLIYSVVALVITYYISAFVVGKEESKPKRQTIWASLVVLAITTFVASFFVNFSLMTYLLLLLISIGLTMFFEKKTKVNPTSSFREFENRIFSCLISSVLFIFLHSFLIHLF